MDLLKKLSICSGLHFWFKLNIGSNDAKHGEIKLLGFLSEVDQLNLTKTKTAVSISKFIKMRLGDTLQFVSYQNQRHLIQANKAVELK